MSSFLSTQSGDVVSHFDRKNPRKGNRDGWLNLGGAFQYSIIADVERQFLLTGGLRFVLPYCEQEAFQGHNPVYISGYLTIGKEFGNAHLLATTGYQFPISGADDRLQLVYAIAHIDYQIAGWLDPLVEVNSSFRLDDWNGLSLGSGVGFFGPGNFFIDVQRRLAGRWPQCGDRA